uniref:CART prepropeptide n=1 Tax=Oncorhynchus kisutch TaxID=8019 RepID=A0A8C7IGP5_ONCKI
IFTAYVFLINYIEASLILILGLQLKLFLHSLEGIPLWKCHFARQNARVQFFEALQEVLEKLQSKQMPAYEKKLGWVPMCDADAGQQCAVRKGARIGKLCECPRGTSCNFSILKCF